MRRGWITGSILIGAAAHAAPASACSCYQVAPFRVEVPGDGATDWPADAGIWIHLHGAWTAPTIAAVAQDYRLRGPDGEVEMLFGRPEGRDLLLRPVRPMRPDTPYTLERLYVYGDGALLPDAGIVDLLDGGSPPPSGLPDEVVRAWFPAATFRTAPAAAPPRGPGLLAVTSARFAVASSGGSCGPGEGLEVRFTHTAPPGSSVGLEVEGQGVVWRAPVPPGTTPSAEWVATTADTFCADPKVHVDVALGRKVRIVEWAPDGARVGASDWTAASRVTEPGSDPAGVHVPRPPDRWHRLRAWWAAVSARARMRSYRVVNPEPAPGPAGCEGGVRAVGKETLFRPWLWEGDLVRSADGWWAGGRAGGALGAAKVAVAVSPGSLGRDPVSLGAVSGFVPVAELEGGGPSPAAFVTWAELPRGAGIRVTRAGPDAAVRWEHVFDRVDDVLAGAGRVLVRSAGRPGEYPTRTPHWTLLDAASGEILASGELGETTRDGVATWDGEAFLLANAWVARDAGRAGSGAGAPGTWMTVIRPDGASRRVSLGSETPPGLAVRIPDGWVLATRASLTWVDHLGQPTAGPYAIPDGVLGPGGWSLAERDGIAFVSGGGPEPGSSARVVALDRAGNVSAPYALPRVDASLARSGDRLVAVYGHLEPDPDQPGWGRAVVGTTELTCASAAPSGPPSRLSPPSARPVRHRPPPYSR